MDQTSSPEHESPVHSDDFNSSPDLSTANTLPAVGLASSPEEGTTLHPVPLSSSPHTPTRSPPRVDLIIRPEDEAPTHSENLATPPGRSRVRASDEHHCSRTLFTPCCTCPNTPQSPSSRPADEAQPEDESGLPLDDDAPPEDAESPPGPNPAPKTMDNDPWAGHDDLRERPPSPWGRKYGTHKQGPGPFAPTNRSWLSPSFPSFTPQAAVDPWRYPNVKAKRHIDPPRGHEADRVLTTEELQRSRLAGMCTWEATIVNNVERYQVGNELVRAEMRDQMLVVDEEGWYPAFRKDRWIDLNIKVCDTDILELIPDGGGDGIWSVDNDALWERLRPCIELANRILRLAARGSWLPSLLDSSAHESSKGLRYTMDRETGEFQKPTEEMIRRFVEIEPSRKLSPDTVADLLHTTDHLISWSFFDISTEHPTPAPYRGQTICIVDCQAIKQSGRCQMTISLDLSLLKPLLSWKLSDVESAMTQHTIGVNMALAYVDALARSRGLLYLEQDMGMDSSETETPRQYAMFFGDESIADHRASFSNCLFGGKLEFPLYQASSAPPDKLGFQFTTTGREFPAQADALRQLITVGEVTGPTTLAIEPNREHMHVSWAIPSLWAASMMNEDFWKVHVAKYGTQALQFPMDIYAKNTFHLGRQHKPRTHPARLAQGRPHTDVHHPGEVYPVNPDGKMLEIDAGSTQSTDETQAQRRLAHQIQTRRKLWAHNRAEWYPLIHSQWYSLPYADVDFREDLRLITEVYFLRRFNFDEFCAHEIAQRWINMPEYLQGPGAGHVSGPVAQRAALCRSVGLMVLAALPARSEKKLCRREVVVPTRSASSLWKLSKEARASPRPPRAFETWWTDQRSPAFVLPARHVGDIRSLRIGLLEEALEALDFYNAHYIPVPVITRPLRAQIRHLMHVLRDRVTEDILRIKSAQSIEARRGGPCAERERADPAGRWLDILFFRIRSYSPTDQHLSGFEDSFPNEVRPPPGKYRGADRTILVTRGYLRQLGIRDFDKDEPVEAPKEYQGSDRTYFTVGEVADHADMGSLWILAREENNELAVYDITWAAQALELHSQTIEDHLEYTEYGRVWRGDTRFFFLEAWDFVIRKGYLIQWYHESDVVAHTVENGRRWTTLGDDIYDITIFHEEKLPYNTQLHAALSESVGGNAAGALRRFKLDQWLPQIKDALRPYKCGQLRRKHTVPRDLPLYLEGEVSWFVNQKTGIYTRIKDGLYDLEDFADWHPGGRKLLLDHAAGADATDLFNRAHADPNLLRSIQHLRVGTVIPEDTPRDLDTTTFKIRDHIYSLGDAKDLEEGSHLYELHKATYWIAPEPLDFALDGGHEAALKLAMHTELITARAAGPKTLPGIRMADLRRCTGKAISGQAINGQIEGWIAVKKDVYNVTCLLKHASSYRAGLLASLCGRVLQLADPAVDEDKWTAENWVAEWLVKNHAARRIAYIDDAAPPLEDITDLIHQKRARHTRIRTRKFTSIPGLNHLDSHLDPYPQNSEERQDLVRPFTLPEKKRLSGEAFGDDDDADDSGPRKKHCGTPGVEAWLVELKGNLPGCIKGLDTNQRNHLLAQFATQRRIMEMEMEDTSDAPYSLLGALLRLEKRIVAIWRLEGGPGVPRQPGPGMKGVRRPHEGSALSHEFIRQGHLALRDTEESDFVREHVEGQRFEIYRAELAHQAGIRAEVRAQMRRRWPRTPNVRTSVPLGENPPYGRRPWSATERMGPRDLPPLPEVWPYGTYSMFRDTAMNADLRELASHHLATEYADEPNPPGRLRDRARRILDDNPSAAASLLPILERFADEDAANNFGDGYSSGEDSSIAALKGLGRYQQDVIARGEKRAADEALKVSARSPKRPRISATRAEEEWSEGLLPPVRAVTGTPAPAPGQSIPPIASSPTRTAEQPAAAPLLAPWFPPDRTQQLWGPGHTTGTNTTYPASTQRSGEEDWGTAIASEEHDLSHCFPWRRKRLTRDPVPGCTERADGDPTRNRDPGPSSIERGAHTVLVGPPHDPIIPVIGPSGGPAPGCAHLYQDF